MNEITQAIFILVIQRAVAIGCGLAIIYWGYSLLRIGTQIPAGGLQTASNDRQSPLRQVVPGAGFALFGFLILAFSIVRGIEIEPVRLQESRPGDESSHSLPEVATSATARPQTQDSAMPAILASSADLPDDIKGLLMRIASGHSLAEFERKAIADWLTGIEQVPATRHDEERRPSGKVRKNKRSPPAPVPHPGEV